MTEPRKNTALYLLLVITALSLFLPLLILVKQMQLKAEIKEQLELASLLTIVLNKEELKWVEPGTELNIGGKLFDVKNLKITGNMVLVTGLFDEEETNYVKNHGDFSESNNPELKDNSAAGFFFSIGYPFEKLITNNFNITVLPVKKQAFYNKSVCSITLSPALHPPDRA